MLGGLRCSGVHPLLCLDLSFLPVPLAWAAQTHCKQMSGEDMIVRQGFRMKDVLHSILVGVWCSDLDCHSSTGQVTLTP